MNPILVGFTPLMTCGLRRQYRSGQAAPVKGRQRKRACRVMDRFRRSRLERLHSATGHRSLAAATLGSPGNDQDPARCGRQRQCERRAWHDAAHAGRRDRSAESRRHSVAHRSQGRRQCAQPGGRDSARLGKENRRIRPSFRRSSAPAPWRARLPPATHPAFAPADMATTVRRSLTLLEKSSTEAAAKGGCASCHHHNITDIAASVANEQRYRYRRESGGRSPAADAGAILRADELLRTARIRRLPRCARSTRFRRSPRAARSPTAPPTRWSRAFWRGSALMDHGDRRHRAAASRGRRIFRTALAIAVVKAYRASRTCRRNVDASVAGGPLARTREV